MLFLLLLAGVALAQEFTENCVPPAKIDPKKEYYIKVGGKGITNFSKEDEGQYLTFTEPNADSSKMVVPVKFTQEWKDTTTKFKIEKFERKNGEKIMIKPVTVTADMNYVLSMYKVDKEKRCGPTDKELKEEEYEISFQPRKNNVADKEEIFTYGRGHKDQKADLQNENSESAIKQDGGQKEILKNENPENAIKENEDEDVFQDFEEAYFKVNEDQKAGPQNADPEDYILQYDDEYKNGFTFNPFNYGWKYKNDTTPVKMKNAYKQTGLYTKGNNLIDTQFCFINTGDISEFLNTVKGDAQIYVDKLKDAFPALKVDWAKMNPTKAYQVFMNQGEKKFQSFVLKHIEDAPGKIEDFIATAFGNIWSPATEKQEENEKNYPNLMRYKKLNRKDRTNANKFIEKQQESTEYGLTADEKKDIPDEVKEEMLVEYFKGPSTPPTDTATQDQQSSGNDQQAKDNPGNLKQEKNLNQNAGTNLGLNVVGKNSALKFTILAVLACLIIQY